MADPRRLLDDPKGLGRVAVFSRGIAKLPNLAELLGARELAWRPGAARARHLDAVVGWGHKPTAEHARRYASVHGVPYIALEDGFLRSVGLGNDAPPLSLCMDDVGIYYDARAASRLEQMLGATQNDPLADPALLDRARRCRERIVDAEISKYNHAPVALAPELADGPPWVIVVDQTLGDASVSLGLASSDSFDRMLDRALADHPDARIMLKVHPDTVAGRRRGYLAERDLPDRVTRVGAAVNPVALLKHAKHVYVVTSQLGFEALMVGKPVTCFGAPFYAGWGLTEDAVRVARRGRQRSVDALIAAALLVYPRYAHPVTGRRCEAEVIIEHLALQRLRFRENSRRFFCLGFAWWKRLFVHRYLSAPGNQVRFVRSVRQLRATDLSSKDTTLVWWASRPAPGLETFAQQHNLPLWRMEDGFLRSVQLGSDLTAPGSLVVDRAGIYYDPSTPSELELILERGGFTSDELARARRLSELIVRSRISKYNAPRRADVDFGARGGKPLVFVPGQVPGDASVRAGSPRVGNDEALLREVRKLRPDAYIVYKPHPDVLSGNRRGRVPGAGTELWDQLVEDVPITACLDAADEVHTMSSFVGFEALLRGRRVVTHGLPFYAGWGLTDDQMALPRRRRRLSTEELVAGALLRYPRYYSWRARSFCTAEDMVEELTLERSRLKLRKGRLPWPLKDVERLVTLARELTRAT
ncbi:MAG: capsular polysaccharide biosynthesis protein [Polyangiaceae bacterium]|nr:capsular polysaccharide biosynthesis protein [Polyangiaceae bacterium]